MADTIYPFTKGGAPKRIYEISKRLAKKGHEVHIFGMKYWKNGKKIKNEEDVFLHGICPPIPRHTRGRRSFREAIFFALNIFRTSDLLRGNFDVIDCDQTPCLHCFPAKVLSLIKDTSLIVTWHEVWIANKYWSVYIPSLAPLGKLVEGRALKLADRIVVTSNKTKNDLILVGEKEEKISVVPVGVDIKRIQNISPFQKEFDIAFVGRLVKGKNVETLLYAVKILAKANPKIKTAIIGDGPEMMVLQKLAEKIHISKNIKFFGFIEDDDKVISILKSSKVFVFPSTQEGGPSIVTLEANACGLPVIAVKHKMGVSSEFIKEAYNGFFVEASPEAIAKKTMMVLESEDLRERVKRNAVIFVKQYDWKRATELTEKVYFQATRQKV